MNAVPRRRRLLHVFATFAVGGPQIRFCQLADALGGRYEHVVVAMDGAYACAERLAPGRAVVFPRLEPPRGNLLARVRGLRTMLAAIRPDVLLTYNWGAIEWAAANLPPALPHVHVADGFGPEEAGGQLRRRVLFRRAVLRWADAVVLPSRLLHGIARDVWKLPERRLAYVPNGIDCDRFAAPRDPGFAARLGLAGLPLIGTVAALRAEKNLGRLLDTFAALERPAGLVIAGDGPERPALEARAARLGVAERVRFLGHVAAPETVLANLDLYALSSDTEQMPYGVIEAMAAGLPVAATDVGDVAAMVAEPNRRFVVAPQALGGALAALLDAPPTRRALGEANRTRARAEFDLARMVAAWDSLFCLQRKAGLSARQGSPAPERL